MPEHVQEGYRATVAGISRDLAILRAHEDPAVKAVAESLAKNCETLNNGWQTQFSAAEIDEQRSQFAKLALRLKDEELEMKLQHVQATKVDVKDVKALIRKACEVPLDTDVFPQHTLSLSLFLTHTHTRARTHQ